MTHGNSLWIVFQFGFWRVEGYGYNFAAQACDAPPMLRHRHSGERAGGARCMATSLRIERRARDQVERATPTELADIDLADSTQVSSDNAQGKHLHDARQSCIDRHPKLALHSPTLPNRNYAP